MTVLWLFGIWSTLERWKSSTSRCLNSWPQSKNIIMFKCCLLLEFYAMMNHFSTRLWHATKSGFYTTGDDQLSVWTKKFQSTSQSQTRTWSLFGGLLLVWSTTAFWILAKPLHLRSMLSKLMRCTENCNACSWHWLTEWTQLFSTTTPDCMLHNGHLKSWTNWAAKFCLICHVHLTSCQSTITSSSILTTFCRENASTTSGMQKMLPKSSWNPKAWIFMLTGINKHFSLAKMCDCNGSYFDL